MCNQNLISVLVTTRNQAATIGRALESILRQRCPWPVEIIVGDDCSTDDTAAVVARYRDAHPGRIRLVSNTRQLGVMANYYACMDRARGRYIADLAGDDEWACDDKLARELRAVLADPSLVLVHTDYAERDARTGRVTPVPFPYTEGATGGETLACEVLAQGRRPVVHLCTALYSREAAMGCRRRWPQFFTGDWPCEDMQLTALIGYEGRVLHLPVATLYYTVGATSVSNGPDDRRQYRFKRACLALAVRLADAVAAAGNGCGSMPPSVRRAFSWRLHGLLMHAFRLGDDALRRDALSLARLWGITPHPLSRLVAAITTTRPTWRLALAVRRLLRPSRR